MSARVCAAVAASAALHLALMLSLWNTARPVIVRTTRVVQLEMIHVPAPQAASQAQAIAARLKPRDQVVVPRALPPGTQDGSTRSNGSFSRAKSSDAASPADGANVDRLWTLRGQPQVPFLAAPPHAEEANELLARDEEVRDVRKGSSGKSEVIAGRGGVKLFSGEDGSIDSFSNPNMKMEGLGAVFDITDMVMEKLGMNPYRYEQHRLAEATREDRHRLRISAQARNEGLALSALSGELTAMWQNSAVSVRQRRKLLFERWDECREDAGDSGSALVRATIETFIRQNLPQGSAYAYSDDELAALNKTRSSKAIFAPYQMHSLPSNARGG